RRRPSRAGWQRLPCRTSPSISETVRPVQLAPPAVSSRSGHLFRNCPFRYDCPMRYVKLGNTGLEVSVITLGCMSFGAPDRGTHSWSLDETASRDIIRQALDAGINFLDTANVYSAGGSEEIVGQAIKDLAQREDVVLATKVFNRMRPGPNG